jgi:hypothetical protein
VPDSITPALTPEEWATKGVGRTDEWYAFIASDGTLVVDSTGHYHERSIDDEDRHALAALALAGQPFGFTWEDVDAARYIAGDSPDKPSRILRSLADRIAALLPPRPPTLLGFPVVESSSLPDIPPPSFGPLLPPRQG